MRRKCFQQLCRNTIWTNRFAIFSILKLSVTSIGIAGVIKTERSLLYLR